MPYQAHVRIGKARRIRRITFDAPGLRRDGHVLVRTERGTEVATLVSEPLLAGARAAPALAHDDDALMRMNPREFWQAMKAAQGDPQLDARVVEEPDADVDRQMTRSEAEPEEERVEYLRPATAADLQRANDLMESTEVDEFALFAAEIARLGLPMKPIQVEHLFGGERILFFFTADERVDFRELVRALAQRFKNRIELRRIQPREATAMAGGVGVCGRELCCSSWLKVLKPVTIKMARTQNRPVSADTNLGVCGRLRCCLRYEMPVYDGEKRQGGGCGSCRAH